MRVPANRVLCTIGTPCTISAVGSTETQRAVVARSPDAIAFAAVDADLVAVDMERSTAAAPRFVHARGDRAGQAITVDEIDATWGERLRAESGIRHLPPARLAPHIPAGIGAPLPHDLEDGGLRRLAGLTFAEIRQSPLSDLFGLFDDDPRLGPGLQSQMFLYAGLGALAALPVPLSQLLPEPQDLRVAAACAFSGLDSYAHMLLGMQPKRETVADKRNDKLAFRLASSLASHGPALLSTLLSPAFNLSRVRRNPDLLAELRGPDSPMRRVPQAPLIGGGACASALITLCDAAASMFMDYPGHAPARMLLWTGADAALGLDARILEGFGLDAVMSQDKLDQMNAGRAPGEQRHVSDCLAPFDIDAQGTVVGHGGSGVLVTTLDFAMRHFLDVTSLVVGFGHSGETGGKGHFAGVGFGGENASIVAYRVAQEAHGYGLADFQHVIAHATGTRTNSRTDLAATHAAREAAAEMQGFTGRLPQMTVGAPKSLGLGHTMAEAGLKASTEAIHYLLGDLSVGVPTLRRIDDQLGEPAEYFRLDSAPVRGNQDGGVLVPTQGFGGYNGALALRGANPDSLRRYAAEPGLVDAYLERWREVRDARVEREARCRRSPGAARRLAEEHCWPAQIPR